MIFMNFQFTTNQTDVIIHNIPNHPLQQKLSTFNRMIHRLFNVPLEKNYNVDLNIIEQIAVNNNDYVKLIDELLMNKTKTRKKH